MKLGYLYASKASGHYPPVFSRHVCNLLKGLIQCWPWQRHTCVIQKQQQQTHSMILKVWRNLFGASSHHLQALQTICLKVKEILNLDRSV